jgi:hypothetical protein
VKLGGPLGLLRLRAVSSLRFIGDLPLQGKKERRALSRVGFDPDTAAMLFDDPLAQRKADPCPRILMAGVQALEKEEDALEILRGNPDAVVPDRELSLAI